MMVDDNMPITAVLFDWDHTLAYSEVGTDDFSARLTAMFAITGLDYSQSQIENALAAVAADHAAGKIPWHTSPQTRQQIGWGYYHLLKKLGHPDLSWPLLIRLYSTYALLPTALYPDVLPVLEQLRVQDYTLGIVSNHSITARPIMENLVGAFIPPHHITISEEEGVHKPARTIFRKAAAHVKTAPKACILIGDNMEVDALGAVQQGGYGGGIWLDRNSNGAAKLPDGIMRITTLQDVIECLAN